MTEHKPSTLLLLLQRPQESAEVLCTVGHMSDRQRSMVLAEPSRSDAGCMNQLKCESPTKPGHLHVHEEGCCASPWLMVIGRTVAHHHSVDVPTLLSDTLSSGGEWLVRDTHSVSAGVDCSISL